MMVDGGISKTRIAYEQALGGIVSVIINIGEFKNK